MRKKLAFYCDFDGTISDRDVIDAFLERFADPRWMEIEKQWKSGAISSRECLRAQLRTVPPMERLEIESFLESVRIDTTLFDLLAFAAQHEFPFYIVSDGFDWFIQAILRNYGIENLPLYSNSLSLVGGALSAGFPLAAKTCSVGSGVCKCKVVGAAPPEDFKIYIGDGRSDFCVAPSADLLFAKANLKNYCEAQRIAYTEFQDFAQVLAAVKPLAEKLFDLPVKSPNVIRKAVAP